VSAGCCEDLRLRRLRDGEEFRQTILGRLMKMGLSLSPTTLASEIKGRTGMNVHRSTLSRFIRGRVTVPSAPTRDALIRFVGFDDDEKQRLNRLVEGWEGRLLPLAGPEERELVSDLLHVASLNEGRLFGEETVVWRYIVGASGDEDECVEWRVTPVGPTGLRTATFGPGQIGGFSWHPHEVGRLRLRGAARNSKGPIFVSLVPYLFDHRGYRILAHFSDPSPNDRISWQVAYTWPDLWNPLRETGRDVGILGHPAGVRQTTVQLLSRDPDLAVDFRRIRGQGHLRQREFKEEALRGWEWTIDDPPHTIEFEVVVVSGS
jgi:hypothetical protein